MLKKKLTQHLKRKVPISFSEVDSKVEAIKSRLEQNRLEEQRQSSLIK